MMSPNMLVVTITSNRSGLGHHPHAAGVNVLVIALDVRIITRDLREGTHPEVVGEGQDVGLGHQGDLPDEALPAIGGGQAAERAGRGATAGQLERIAERPLDAGAGVDRGLDRDLLGRPLPQEPAGADVEVLVVLADDDHVDVLGPLAADRALDAREELDRAEVDVLVKIEPQPEQDPLLEHARGHPRDARRRPAGWRRTSRSSRTAASGRTSPVRR